MEFKRKIIVSSGIVVLLILFLLIAAVLIRQNKEDYKGKMASVLSQQDTTTVHDIFPFEFEKAYVFDDCYISGDGFARRYNLDISISQVKSGVSEGIHRIVFVDKEGAFVHEFKCNSNEIIVLEEGVILYPTTVIERESAAGKSPIGIRFKGVEHLRSLK